MTRDIAELGFRWASALLDGFAQAGVRRVVASPGSRSTPLTLAAMRHPDLQTHVVLDERSAGFFALGLAKAEKRPVALVATSGSAVANWTPAVVEADLARVPLILLSADRPPELHDCGANQTMDQMGFFGRHVRAFHQLPPPEPDASWLPDFSARAVALSFAPLAGPVHINLPLREPLTPGEGGSALHLPAAPDHMRGRLAPDEAMVQKLSSLLTGREIVICGPEDLGEDFREAVVDLAQRLRLPIFADILSGLRFGGRATKNILAHPDWIARGQPRFDWALRFGAAPVSKATNQWLRASAGVVQIVVAGDGRFADPDRVATHLVNADPADLCRALGGKKARPDWLDSFLARDAAAGRHADSVCAKNPAFEGGLLRALFQILPEGAPLFLANSLVIRSAEWFCGAGARKLVAFGNRGLSGIDGNLSTACGIAAALGRCVAALGDLTFLHDINALLLARDLPLTLLLVDNGGGGIFRHLSQRPLPEFERGWLTPQQFDANALARAFGLDYRRAETTAEAMSAVAASFEAPGAMLVHVVIDPEFSLRRCQEFFAASQVEPAL